MRSTFTPYTRLKTQQRSAHRLNQVRKVTCRLEPIVGEHGHGCSPSLVAPATIDPKTIVMLHYGYEMSLLPTNDPNIRRTHV